MSKNLTKENRIHKVRYGKVLPSKFKASQIVKMSNMTVLRMASALTLSKNLASKSMSVSGALVPRHSFSVSPIARERIYGPEALESRKDASSHWMNERYLMLGLIPIIPTALAFPHPALDMLLTTTVVLHSHWGLSGVFNDYVHGSILPKIHQPLILFMSICTFGALTYFNYTDIGFARAVQMIYTQL